MLFSFLAPIKRYASNFLSLFYPPVCLACSNTLNENENIICSGCLNGLPLTKYHKQLENEITRIFWGRIAINYATSLFFFQKDTNYQTLMHNFKYKGYKQIGEVLGVLIGHAILESQYFGAIDCIIPVPLHPKKLRERGYNQSYFLAKGIASVIQIPVFEKVLQRKIYSSTQTKKGRVERWENMSGIFHLKDEGTIENKHVLLVDDILTTGATLEACSHQLISNSNNVTLSIVTAAYAKI